MFIFHVMIQYALFYRIANYSRKCNKETFEKVTPVDWSSDSSSLASCTCWFCQRHNVGLINIEDHCTRYVIACLQEIKMNKNTWLSFIQFFFLNIHMHKDIYNNKKPEYIVLLINRPISILVNAYLFLLMIIFFSSHKKKKANRIRKKKIATVYPLSIRTGSD